MKIFIDIFIEDPSYESKMSEQEKIFYDGIIQLVNQRLSPLKDKIDNEEIDNNLAFTCIYVLHVVKGNFIKFAGYSDELKLKMNNCFSSEDFKYFDAKIGESISKLN